MPIVYGALVPGNRYIEICAEQRYGTPDILRLLREQTGYEIESLKSNNYLTLFRKYLAMPNTELCTYFLSDEKANDSDDSSCSSTPSIDCNYILVGLPLEKKKARRFDTIDEIFSDHRKSKVYRRLERSGLGEFRPSFYYHHYNLNISLIKIDKPKLLK